MQNERLAVREEVVLLDETGTPVGTADKSTVHSTETPLHLAFSCYVLNAAGQLLLTQRALDKLTWPGVWSNSFCGHPAPGEQMEAAVRRRAHDELGMQLGEIRLALPDFRYRAVDSSGIVEHEICPVFVAQATTEPIPNPAEVADYRWVDVVETARDVAGEPDLVSPWMGWQLPLLLQIDALTPLS